MTIRLPREHATDLAYTRPRALAAVRDVRTHHMIRTWSFDGSLPQGWQLAADAHAAPETDGMTITTGSTEDGVQLESPPIRLPRGSYWAVADGSVESGGLQLGVEPAGGRSCSSAAYFDPQSTAPSRSALPVLFSADGRRPVRIAIANWVSQAHASTWRLRRIRLVAAAGVDASSATARYAARASPLVNINALPVVNLVSAWSFTGGVPPTWTKSRTARVRIEHSGTLVQTDRDLYGFVFTATLNLGAGPYLLRLDGRILRGGMMLGALETQTRTWLAQRFYWSGQRRGRGVLGVPFSLRHGENVELVIGNWAVKRAASTWLVHGLELDQLF